MNAFLSSTESEQDNGTNAPIWRRLALVFTFFTLERCLNFTAAHRRILLNGVITLVTTVSFGVAAVVLEVDGDPLDTLDALTDECGRICDD